MDVDDCFSKVVGSFGKYQILVYCISFIYALCTPGLALLTVFVGEDPMKLKLDNFRVNNKSSILTEWGLNQQWIDFTQVLYFGGFLVGVVVFGQLSDKFGRRLAMILGYSLLFPACLLASFSSSIEMYATLRFMIGLLGGGVTLVQFVYLQEIVGREWWVITGSLQNFMFPMGVLLLVLGAYFLPDWRHLLQFLSIIQIPPLIFVMYLPESPRWLYSIGQRSKAERVLQFFAKWNGVKNPVCSLKPLELEKPNHNYTLIDLLRHRITAQRVALMAFSWFVNSFVYYALTLAAGEFGSNIYASEALSGIIEVPSLFLCSLLLSKSWCGRKRGVSGALLITGFACLILMAFDPNTKSNGKMWVALVGKMAVSFSFNGIYVYSPELFPTCVRNVSLGSLSMFARVGGMAASYAKTLLMNHPMIGYFTFGSIGIASGLLTCFLPETLGTKPPDSFEELEKPNLRRFHENPDSFVLLDSSGFRRKSEEESKQLLNSEDEDEVL